MFLLVVAGHETTVNLIGNGTLALLQFASERLSHAWKGRSRFVTWWIGSPVFDWRYRNPPSAGARV